MSRSLRLLTVSCLVSVLALVLLSAQSQPIAADATAAPTQAVIEPHFVDYPEPAPVDNMPLIREVGCSGNGYSMKCSSSSPLSQFKCDELDDPRDIGAGIYSIRPVIATCLYGPPSYNFDPPTGPSTSGDRQNYLFETGCMFRHKVGYIFKVNGNYVLVTTAKEMQEVFAPIDSPLKALSYAQMVTGLEAIYRVSAMAVHRADEDAPIFIQKTVTGTHVVESENGYLVNLYDRGISCGCHGDFVTTQVTILIDRAGELKWGDRTPIYHIRGGCVD